MSSQNVYTYYSTPHILYHWYNLLIHFILPVLWRVAEEHFQELLKLRLPLKHLKSVRLGRIIQTVCGYTSGYIQVEAGVFRTIFQDLWDETPEENLENEDERLSTKNG